MRARELLARAEIVGVVGALGEELCWEVLAASPWGRRAVVADDGPEILPVNFATDGPRIYFRTAPGGKLAAFGHDPRVALEVDGVDEDGAAAFSVMVKGVADALDAPSEIELAESLPLAPWTATRKLRWVRVRAHSITGRAFRLGPEPDSFV